MKSTHLVDWYMKLLETTKSKTKNKNEKQLKKENVEKVSH